MSERTAKNEQGDFYETTLERLLDKGVLNREAKLLVVCGGHLDREVLLRTGFSDVTITNLDSRLNGSEFSPFRWGHQDAEKLAIPDEEYDFCIAHNGLHHCAS